jgi:hypothetical protein
MKMTKRKDTGNILGQMEDTLRVDGSKECNMARVKNARLTAPFKRENGRTEKDTE